MSHARLHGMDTKAFSFNSQAKYRAGGHFKEKADILVSLSLAYQEIMVDDQGSHLKAVFLDIFADYQNPPFTGDVAVANKAWKSGKHSLQLVAVPASLRPLVRLCRLWGFI